MNIKKTKVKGIWIEVDENNQEKVRYNKMREFSVDEFEYLKQLKIKETEQEVIRENQEREKTYKIYVKELVELISEIEKKTILERDYKEFENLKDRYERQGKSDYDSLEYWKNVTLEDYLNVWISNQLYYEQKKYKKENTTVIGWLEMRTGIDYGLWSDIKYSDKSQIEKIQKFDRTSEDEGQYHKVTSGSIGGY